MKLSLTRDISLTKQHLSLIVLFAAYGTGILCIGYGLLPELLYATPFNLLLTFALIFWNSKIELKRICLFMLFIYLIGFVVELIGVNTGVIFGAYEYGYVLGPKVFHTPIIIGINWIIMVYGGLILVHQIIPHRSILLKSLCTAALMVAIDFILEPVAMHYGFWSWSIGDAPIANYIAWFVISCIISMITLRLKMEEDNWVAVFGLLCITVFFILLNNQITDQEWMSFTLEI